MLGGKFDNVQILNNFLKTENVYSYSKGNNVITKHLEFILNGCIYKNIII